MAATYSSLVGVAVGGKYEIRRVLGAGGMGVVCEGVHLDLGKRVAIKLIDKSMKETELIVERFRREARALGQIESEHIVTVSDFGADPRVGLYTVMELLAGEDLQRRLEREQRVDVKTAVMIAHQCARGLKKAHAAGVVHRDLKPANVFLSQRDNGQLLVKILDFGVSKILDSAMNGTGPGAAARITGSGTPIGTPLYMSPEQAEGRDDIDGRADVWSLGAVLYEALAGSPPFADKGSYHGTIVGILTSRPALLHDVAPWVPSPLAKVIDAMLVHDPAARISGAEAVTKRLLEAFPAVLPDGTGRHTAIVVSQDAAIDGTGDTEIFGDAVREELRRRRSSRPSPTPVDPTGPHKPSSAGRTGAATPVDVPDKEDFHSVSHVRSPKTLPLDLRVPSSHPSSSAGGVAMPGTPPEIDPLPQSAFVPDTIRDIELAKRGERRRVLSMVVLAVAIASVAVGGYFLGQRSHVTAEPLPTVATVATTSTPSATAPSAAAPTTATATVESLPAASAEPAASVAPVRKPLRRVVKPKTIAVAPSAEPSPEPTGEAAPKTNASPVETNDPF